MEFQIKTYWDSRPFDHKPIKLVLSKASNQQDLNIHVEAPFFNDPQNPGGPTGQSYWTLWEYEVVEAFFLNDQDEYLEIILCPNRSANWCTVGVHGNANGLLETLPPKTRNMLSIRKLSIAMMFVFSIFVLESV